MLRKVAGARNRPVDEILTLYGLERFLGRLNSTVYASDFCLKGGVLLAAHALRRPTRDIDMQALDFQLDVEHVTEVIAAVSEVDVDDGVTFDPSSMTVEQIRDEDEYSGLRVTLRARLHTAKLVIRVDISTGDPIWPAPEVIELPSLLQGTVTVNGHPLVTVIAEKTVTMLQRGTTSTRWRDLLDVAALSDRYEFNSLVLEEAIARVAAYRDAELEPLEPLLLGYGQARWAAWRRANKVEDLCLLDLDDQVRRVLGFVSPVFGGTLTGDRIWNPGSRSWA